MTSTLRYTRASLQGVTIVFLGPDISFYFRPGHLALSVSAQVESLALASRRCSLTSAGGQAAGMRLDVLLSRRSLNRRTPQTHLFPVFHHQKKTDGEHTPARCVADDASFLVVFGKSSIEEKKVGNNSPLGYYCTLIVLCRGRGRWG